ncbi:putative helicase, P-loop containing nucleoside triphosphate hydrolase [Helianthus annuus]|uniref:Helicase, P-loop containing nucleoside triphosphate hydrolase n=1 Tax=Helianthus annuus TaxID=4232 RepID=A0A9K3JFX9_HELAN|nr:putative helicase, P-loop containing nucleoside triphosphate hydrolase [Helianthus annuus]KAJ0592899.1 putative helicase, P-loop containing nucleoside triphosphate hydrolase [Helianthus annuus]KAJ0600598.1 putative helicase, P-loop containing nucleoside triphosphate hydrolase [Helianthus annuus]KAJ0607901.1 putative helicase, P-loop containing nucleoside triphosphate hydrolase [Helianthus annuus]KAJ0767966.1 putative helicase, P-loop containing nucleoside triphosphate hydrolase [Helianthus a
MSKRFKDMYKYKIIYFKKSVCGCRDSTYLQILKTEILLFLTTTRLLDVMEDYLYWKKYKYLRLDGHTSGGDRGALIDQSNNPGSPFFIFLLSIRAGGVGVNLQATDTVIIFYTNWNPQALHIWRIICVLFL